MKKILIILVFLEITIASMAQVGIGTTQPTAKLHVVGDTRLVDGTQGIDKLLRSDALGNTSWVNTSINTGFKAIRTTSSQTISSATNTIVIFNSESFDDGNNYDSTNGSFTCPTSGVYHFDATVTWNGFTGGSNWSHIYIYKNSTTEDVRLTTTSTGYFSNNISTTIKCNANDVITVKVYQQSGSNQSIYLVAGYSSFSGYRLY